MTDSPKQAKTSISLRPQDRQRLAELGLTPTEAIRAFCAGEAPALPTASIAHIDTVGMSPEEIAELVNPQPIVIRPEVGPHGWRRQGLRWIARAGSLDDAARLAAAAVGAKLAAPHVLLTAEEVPNG